MSLKPATPIEEIYQFLPYIHLVLIMTVEPGLGGQTLIPETIEKVKKLRKYIDEKELEVDIQADGGINLQNIELLKEAGIDNVVIGSALIKAEDKNDMINKLKK
jgi:rpe: ribulose-phosphate 3-epimerase